MSIRYATIAACFAVSSIITPALAQPITDSFSYQGTLEDDGLPANGLYDITFLVYNNLLGGDPIPNGTVTVFGVQVEDGRFTTTVDFGVSGEVFDTDQARWLEVQVAKMGVPGTTTLEPRQKLTPTTIANYALRSGTTLQDAYENSAGQLVINGGIGPLELWGAQFQAPIVNFYSGASALRLSLGIQSSQDTGYLKIFGDQNEPLVTIERDQSLQGGAYMELAGNDSGEISIILEGNRFGTGSGHISVFGTGSTVSFDTRFSGDSSVILPGSSVRSSELYNEAGAAETENSTTVLSLTDVAATIDILDTVTINAPTSGLLLVIATAEISVLHNDGSSVFGHFGVSRVSSSIPANGDVELLLPSVLPAGTYDYPVTVHGLLSASPGENTIYFLGDKNSTAGTMNVLDVQLTAVYIPTAYGSVSREGGFSIPDEHLPVMPSRNEYQVLEERNAALRADLERQQREIEENRALIQSLKERLDQRDE